MSGARSICKRWQLWRWRCEREHFICTCRYLGQVFQPQEWAEEQDQQYTEWNTFRHEQIKKSRKRNCHAKQVTVVNNDGAAWRLWSIQNRTTTKQTNKQINNCNCFHGWKMKTPRERPKNQLLNVADAALICFHRTFLGGSGGLYVQDCAFALCLPDATSTTTSVLLEASRAQCLKSRQGPRSSSCLESTSSHWFA